MRELIASIVLSVFTIVLFLSMPGCGPTWKEVTPPLGTARATVTITVQEDWCLHDGRKVNGTTQFSKKFKNFCNICVSLKSDDTERTMNHELDHCWRNMLGLDATARNK